MKCFIGAIKSTSFASQVRFKNAQHFRVGSVHALSYVGVVEVASVEEPVGARELEFVKVRLKIENMASLRFIGIEHIHLRASRLTML